MVFQLLPQVMLGDVIDACPARMTGADFHALANAAAMNAVRRAVSHAEQHNDHSSLQCAIEQDDLLLAASTTVPSVTKQQMENYNRISQVIGK